MIKSFPDHQIRKVLNLQENMNIVLSVVLDTRLRFKSPVFVHENIETEKSPGWPSALLVTGGVKGKLQRPQWRPGQSPWRTFCFCERRCPQTQAHTLSSVDCTLKTAIFRTLPVHRNHVNGLGVLFIYIHIYIYIYIYLLLDQAVIRLCRHNTPKPVSYT